MSEQKNQNSGQKNKKALNDFAKYSTIGFQMIAIMILGAFGGMKLDKWISAIEFPLFTIVLTLAGVIIAIYYSIKDFLKPKK